MESCYCGKPLGEQAECARCKAYRCETCRRVCPWEYGGGDDFPGDCPACWCVKSEVVNVAKLEVNVGNILRILATFPAPLRSPLFQTALALARNYALLCGFDGDAVLISKCLSLGCLELPVWRELRRSIERQHTRLGLFQALVEQIRDWPDGWGRVARRAVRAHLRAAAGRSAQG